MKSIRRLVTVGHSYTVANNRRLAHEMARAGRDRWEIVAVAPQRFHGRRDLRSVTLEAMVEEPCRLEAVPAYLTRFVHVFLYGGRLRQILSEGWDIVHCWEEPYILAGAQLAHWTPQGARLVFRTAQSIQKDYPFPFNRIERYAMRKAAGWICSGRLVAQTLGRRGGYDERPMALIPLGVDVDAFAPDAAAKRSVRRSLGWDPDGPPVVGYLGRLVPEKGLTLLMRALDEQLTAWRALIVGAGPMEPDVRRWASGHSDRVRICNDIRHGDVPPYLNAMDVLCAPSQTTPRWREQFGRMLIEGFACGVPVIGSDSGEISSVIGEAGLIKGENDLDGWREAIADLLENRATRDELSCRGRDMACSRYSWNVVARQHLDFFEQLLDQTGGIGDEHR